MMCIEPPSQIETGWPVKIFYFTGEWQKVVSGNRRTAMRNRQTVHHPVYRAKDGDWFLLCSHTKTLPDDRC